jgi:hypothetical protein
MIDRYVVCDTETMLIVGGPYMWDPEAAPGWSPPEAGELMTEAAAFAAGYSNPAPPDPDAPAMGD